jgi:hypothetical protein
VQEILPGVWHWTAFHEGIGQPVSSHYVEPAAALIDPMVPEEGVEWFTGRDRAPERILLSNRHHYRHSERFDLPVLCVHEGLHEFEGTDRAVEGFDFGEEVAPGVRALEVGAICLDDTALHIDVGEGALLFADGLIRLGDELAFVPDFLMGDDPQAVKSGLRESLEGLLGQPFDHLLFAHGEPLVGGKRALRDFLAA